MHDHLPNAQTEQSYSGTGFEGDNGDLNRELRRRHYYYRNDPRVDVFDIRLFRLALAVNTAQFGRTFQDRWDMIVSESCAYTNPLAMWMATVYPNNEMYRSRNT